MVFVLGVLTLLALVGLVLIARTHGESRRLKIDSVAANSRSVMDGIIQTVQERLRQDIWGPDPSPDDPNFRDDYPMPLNNQQPPQACCLPGPACADLDPRTCVDRGGLPQGAGTACATMTCPQPPQVQACCLPNDSCQDLLPYDCAAQGGSPQGPGTACATTKCEHIRETNEPWDAPGDSDRWLASTTPYMLDENGDGNADSVPTGNTTPPFDLENGVLVWRNVSYLGMDLLDPDGPANAQPFAWAANSRIAVPTPVTYSAAALENVRILQTPPNGFTLDLIPGSTTNLTIAEARDAWSSAAHQTALSCPTCRFPYFDTNADGAVDLYDADGDGVPESPISFIVPMDTADPNSPRQLYAAIRVVDHASMLNVNVASSMRLPPPSGTGAEPMFDETFSGLQRRGRRMTEMLIDDTLHPDDRFGRTRGMVGDRSGDDPVAYDTNIVRRLLAGGSYAGPAPYFLYGLSDEASLRHRGMLAPYDRRFDDAALPADNRTIDRALRGTLAWSRQLVQNPDFTYSYNGTSARWTRLNSNFVAGPLVYEGEDDANGKGWRWMLREDESYAIRRHLLTTISRETSAPPPGILFDQSTGNSVVGLPLSQVRCVNGSGNAYGMAWPVLDRVTWPAIADWMRVLPIDLNMRTQSSLPADILAVKETYITYLAGAVYRALEGIQSYQGSFTQDSLTTPGDDTLNREYFAWQFAVNAADYRDGDNIPTILEWPAASGHYLFGVEKQPFFTEAYAFLLSNDPPGPSPTTPPPDDWFHAVELYVPPYWRIPTVDPNNPGQPILYLHSRGVTPNILIPLNSFAQVASGTTPTDLYGDPATGGTYYVFCGPTDDAPTGLAAAVNGYYRNAGFKFAANGNAEIELVFSPTGAAADPLTHSIDAIGPAYSGPPLAIGSSGSGEFAKNNFAVGERHEFSLLRSTQGWNFTTGWQVYAHRQVPSPFTPPGAPLRRSLGLANNTSDAGSLDDNIPPSVWPGRAAFTNAADGHEPLDSFGPGEPFAAFDSPAEINRLYMFGPIRRALALEPPYLLNRSGVEYGVGVDIPVTLLLAETLLNGSISDLTSISPERVGAGRLDFNKPPPAAGPWPTRLLSWFTTTSPLFDGIDNDGDGVADLGDPTEGVDVLNRIAGRININTAPVSVLRAVPFMSLLPTSVEFVDFSLGGPPAGPHDYAGDFANAGYAGLFYDMAAAIVAARENRRVPVRLPDGLGIMQNVATAEPDTSDSDSPGYNGYFASVADLDRLTHVFDATKPQVPPSPTNELFQVDRFSYQPNNSALALYNHKLNPPHPTASDPSLGTSEPFSPDFRYRRADNNGNGIFDAGDEYVADYVPVIPPVLPGGEFEHEFTYPGIRARDIYLARWANMLTVRSDVFTAYITLIDDQGHYVQRSQVTLDRSECFRERPERAFVAGIPLPPAPGSMVMPRIVTRTDGSYEEEVH